MSVWVKHRFQIVLLVAMSMVLVACGGDKDADSDASEENTLSENPTMEELEELAKEEGEVISVGMPDSWANWEDTWNDLEEKYGLSHNDSDIPSGEQIAKFEAEQKKATADIGDIGMAFTDVAVDKGVTEPYKTEFWDDVPDWAKDEDGHWVVAYQGTISFICNSSLVEKCPEGWDDIKEADDYEVVIGDVARGAQNQFGVLAAAMAYGGDEGNIEPGLDYFKELAADGKISKLDNGLPSLEKGETQVLIIWDFNALGYRDKLGPEYEVNIPKEGSVVSGYTTIINKYAQNMNAAKLTRGYILSDEGQINLAKGFARPIRDNVEMPAEVEENMLPLEQYDNAKPVEDYDAWEETVKELAERWDAEVMSQLN